MKPGVYVLSMAEYQADPCEQPSLSSGIAKILTDQSPRHAWFAHPRLNPAYELEEAGEFDLGTCAHAVLFEGEDSIAAIDPQNYPSKTGGIPAGWTNGAIRAARDEARAQGKTPILIHKMAEIRAMADAARKALVSVQGIAPIALDAGKAEQVIIWQEGPTWCRARPDWMRLDRRVLLDYKSTAGSANPAAWIRNQMVPLGFDIQAAHYLRGNAATGGAVDCDWIFLVQENYAPYECSFVSLGSAMLEFAQRKWEYALSLWQSCMERNQWNGYPRRVFSAEPTAWQIDEDEERRLTFEERLELATV